MKLKMKKLSLEHKRLVLVSAAIILVVCLSAGAVVYKVSAGKEQEETVQAITATVQQGELSLGISGDGTTYVGSNDQTFDLSYGSSGITLVVEEVMAASGDTVSKGDSLLKVSTEEVKELITYYEEQIKSAENTLKTAKLNYESDLAQAKYDYEVNLNLGESSLLSYEASINELQDAVDEAKEAIEDADDQIEEYTNALANNTYYTKYKVASLKEKAAELKSALSKATSAFNKVDKTYASDKKTYESAIEKLQKQLESANKSLSSAEMTYEKKLNNILNLIDTAENPETYTVEAAYLTELKEAKDAVDTAQSKCDELNRQIEEQNRQLQDIEKSYSEAQSAKEQANQEYESANQKYEEALSNYKKAKEEAQENLDSLNDNYSSLEDAYDEALRNQETETISINKEYEVSQLTYENAKSIYDATVKDLDADVTSAQETLDALNDNLSLLTSIQDDGIIKAEEDGTIYSVSYEAEDEMAEQSNVVSYVVADTIDIDFTVSQEDIASIAVGDTVSVTVGSSRFPLEGTVSSIATEPTTSGSVSSVTYTATVSVDNSDGQLSSGSDAEISIVKETLENVLYVPVDAVSTSGSTSTVTVQNDDGTTEKVNVTTGQDNGTYIVITDGLSAGDVCVIEA